MKKLDSINAWQHNALQKAGVKDIAGLRAFVIRNKIVAEQAHSDKKQYFMTEEDGVRFNTKYFKSIQDDLEFMTSEPVRHHASKFIYVDKKLYGLILSLQKGNQIIKARDSYKLRGSGLATKIGTGGIIPRQIFNELEKIGVLQYRGKSGNVAYWGYSPEWKQWTVLPDEPLRGKDVKALKDAMSDIVETAVGMGMTKKQVLTIVAKTLDTIL